MDIYNKTLAAGAQADIPVKWCKILADALLEMEERLGIIIDVVPREDRCLWIIILPSSSYSKASSDNLDIVGFDFHGDEDEVQEFTFITVVGFRNYWYNASLYKKLLANPNFIANIEKAYSGCRFDRQIRFNKYAATFYATITSYDTLSDYLNAVGDNVYFPSFTPRYCIEKLNDLGVTEGDAIDKLNSSGGHADYNWLEYLHIVSKTPINCKLFLKKDPVTIAEFERQIEQHLRGMILIDDIFNV